VSVEVGAEKLMTAHQWNTISSVAWLADGSGVVISALDLELAPNAQLWQLSYPGGEEIKITNDLNDYRGVSLTSDSGALLTMQESLSLSLWIVPKGETSRATEITARTGKTDGRWGVAWTPDGKIVYYSTASGSLDLWIMNADGSNQKQLTMNAGQNFSPAVSPDGRYLVFGSDRAGARGIWRMNLDGSSPKQLAGEGSHPRCSPDGKWVVYHGSSPPTLWKVLMEGGAPVQLTNELSHYAAISPDGKLIAYFSGGPTGNITVIPFEGGPPIKTFDSPRGSLLPGLRWTPDGQALTYVRGGNIWSQPIAGGPPKQLTDFNGEQIYTFDWSRDGRLVVSRGVVNRDVVLISGFK
jgi:Tol biopolymer transport system component